MPQRDVTTSYKAIIVIFRVGPKSVPTITSVSVMSTESLALSEVEWVETSLTVNPNEWLTD